MKIYSQKMNILPEEIIGIIGSYLNGRDFKVLLSLLNKLNHDNITNYRCENIYKSTINKNKFFLSCINENDTNFIKFLLDNGVSPNDKNSLSLTLAAAKGYVDIFQLLLDHPKVNLNMVNSSIKTAANIIELLQQDSRVDLPEYNRFSEIYY
jgi:ankyrin repeat protein